jgi:hypothetical protein
MNIYDTGDKLFTGVNDTGEKFIAGVADTSDYSNPCQGEITKKALIFHRSQRHWRLKSPAYISLPTPKN